MRRTIMSTVNQPRRRHTIRWGLVFGVLAGLLCGLPQAEAKKETKVWTDTPEWAGASQVKNTTWTDVAGQLQLIKNAPKSKSTPFIYIPNSSSNTIAQLDTKTGKKNWVISLDSVAKNSDPSRTTVDAKGDVWVGLRNTTKVVWISAAGKIKKIVDTGKRPRAITVDLNGDVWVGGYDANNLTKLNGKTGAKLFTVATDCPYGATTDIKGNIWVVNRCKGKLSKHRNSDGKIIKVSDAADGYGIATDLNGQVWVARYGGGCVHRYDNNGNPLGCADVSSQGCKNPRGLAVDGDNNLWVACSNSPVAVKVSATGQALGKNTTVGSHCVGVAVDADGFVWIVARGDATATKINTKTLKAVGKYPTHGSGPYTYSDMTGFQFQNIAQPAEGTWRSIHSSQCHSKWLSLSWNGTTPQGTSITIRARTAHSRVALATAKWSAPLSNGAKPAVPDAPWIEIEVSMKTFDGQITPSVTDITLVSEPTGVEICDGKDNDCDGFIDNVPGTNTPLVKNCRTKCGSGVTSCHAGDWLVCSAPYPTVEICDGKDNDCDGEIDEGTTLCGANSLCNAGTCKRSCTGECPLGQTCKDIDGGRYCVGNTPCAQLEAQCKSEGKVCRNGRCVGVCEGIQCPAEHLCTNGKCIKDDCYNNPKKCIPGQYCKAGQCTANPCSGVQCSNQQQCKNGKCVGSCADVQCPAGQSCKDGTCQGDPCAGVQCPAGQACVAGTCAADPCLSVACQNGQTCTGGKCIDDPCAAVVCPAGQVCVRPQGDCFGRGPGQPTEGPPGDAGPSPEPVVTPDAPAQPDTPSTTPDTPSGDQGIVTKTPDQINYTPPESVTRPRGNTCVCNVDNPTEGFGMAAFFMLLFFGFFSLLRRKP